MHPDPAKTAAILSDLADPRASLADVAARHGVTLDALSLWLHSPATRARIDELEALALQRARLAAAAQLPMAVAALGDLLTAYRHDEANASISPTAPAADPKALAARTRQRESARRAAGLLLRIVNIGLTPRRAARPVARPSFHQDPADPRAEFSAEPHTHEPASQSTLQPDPRRTHVPADPTFEATSALRREAAEIKSRW